MEKIYLTEQQVADLLQISASKLRQDRQRGEGIPFVRIGSSVRYDPDEVQNYVKKHTVRAK